MNNKQKDIKEQIITALKTIMDPEIPVNIYDLGLIYNIEIDKNHNAHIQMTLTTPRCPLVAFFPQQVEQTISEIPEVNKVTVELAWDPPWSIELMSDTAKQQLGLEKK